MLLGGLLLVACVPESSPVETGTASDALVLEIIDGDTIVVADRDQPVRLLDLNAPEVDECFYEDSRDSLASLVGSTVMVDTRGEDRFGRSLAYVWMGEDLINTTLVRNGNAIAMTPVGGPPGDTNALEAEEDAFSTGRGLWSATACGSSGSLPDVSVIVTRFDPPGPDDDVLDQERVTIRNESGSDLDLSGWVIRDESSTHRYMFRDVTLQAGGTIEIASSDAGWVPGGSPVWNNDGDMALLLDEVGTVVARHRYP